MEKCIINGKIVLKDKIVDKNLYISNNVIYEISSREPKNIDIIDAHGLYVSPGFIDTHTHGRMGVDTMNCTFESLNKFSLETMKTGVTSFLPTTMTMPVKDIAHTINQIELYKNKVEGATILGIHMEGQFFSSKYKGAQNEKHMLEPTIQNYLTIVGNHLSLIRKISIAPEIGDSKQLIHFLTEHNTVVSIGHSNATYEQANESFKFGITSATHTFNAMTELNHRSPGIVGATMLNNDVYAELILDNSLVSFPAGKILLKTKGKDKIVLITDSFEGTGLKDGHFHIGDQAVILDNGIARLENGVLAASTLSLNEAVRNAYKELGLPLYDAINLASLNPAKSIHEEKRGEIKVGNYADIILFDENINIKKVFILGKEQYKNE